MSKTLYISNISGKKLGYSFCGTAIEAAHSLDMEMILAANRAKSNRDDIIADEEKYGVKLLHSDISRNPFAFCQNYKAYKQLIKFIHDYKIDYIHCNTPVGGVLGRFAGKKCKVKKVIYQVHGFHFYKGAPKKNWLLYYPVEKWLARYTDALITINQEDYTLAKRKMKLKNGGQVYYVPGVGIDLEKFIKPNIDRAEKRRELGIPEDAILLLSVGELNQNKNHETIIRSIKDSNVHYIIAGEGELHTHLQNLIDILGIENRVKILGYRNDIKELYATADIFVLPSFREGLSRSIMEAMASGLPCVVSNIRGNTDLLENGEGGFLCDPHDYLEFAKKINLLATNTELREKMGRSNLVNIKKFSMETVGEKIRNIYVAEFFGN